jgi:AbiTii
VLAARLNNDELRAWVAKELNGYENAADVPEYRILDAPAVGHLAGPFGSGYQNMTIPAMVLPEDLRHYAEEIRLTQPIAAVEELGKGDGVVTCNSGDLVAYMQSKEGNKFANRLILYGAWQTVSKASVHGIVDTVRNRVLEFALRLEKEAPAAGEPEMPGSRVSNATVSHLYPTNRSSTRTTGQRRPPESPSQEFQVAAAHAAVAFYNHTLR